MILIISALTIHKTTQELINDLSWVIHYHKAEGLIQSISSQIKDAETGQRGYLLTNGTTYLEPYEASITIIYKLIENTKELTKDNPSQQARIKNIKMLTTEKLQELKATIDLHRSGNRDQAMKIVLSNHGKHTMDKLRMVLADMRLVETCLLEERVSKAKLTSEYISQVTSIGSLVLLLFMGINALLMLHRIRAYETDRASTEKELANLANRDTLTKLYNRRSLESAQLCHGYYITK